MRASDRRSEPAGVPVAPEAPELPDMTSPDNWRAGWSEGWAVGHAVATAHAAAKRVPHRAGPMELALRRDLVELGYGDGKPAAVASPAKGRPGRATLAMMAGVLARAIDAKPIPATTAKLVQELRAVMALLRSDGQGDSDAIEADGTAMSTPVRDAS